jgi:hypothetical protein
MFAVPLPHAGAALGVCELRVARLDLGIGRRVCSPDGSSCAGRQVAARRSAREASSEGPVYGPALLREVRLQSERDGGRCLRGRATNLASLVLCKAQRASERGRRRRPDRTRRGRAHGRQAGAWLPGGASVSICYIRSQLPSPYTQHLCCGTAAGTAWWTAPRRRMASGLTAFGAYPRNEVVRGSSPRVGLKERPATAWISSLLMRCWAGARSNRWPSVVNHDDRAEFPGYPQAHRDVVSDAPGRSLG